MEEFMETTHSDTYELPTHLRDWISPSHREWEWYFDEAESSLQRISTNKTQFYVQVPGRKITRLEMKYANCWSGNEQPTGHPYPVKISKPGETAIRATVTQLAA